MFSQSLKHASSTPSLNTSTRQVDLSQRSFRSVSDFRKAKRDGRKISMLSVYDAVFARLAVDAGVNTLLVGDSVAMALYGFESTIHAFFFSSRRRHTSCGRDWSSDVCSSDLG